MNNIILLMRTIKMIPAPLILQVTQDGGDNFANIFYNNTNFIKIGTEQHLDIPESINPVLVQFDIKIADLKHYLNLMKVQLTKLSVTELKFLQKYLLAKDMSNKCYQLATDSSIEEARKINNALPSFFQGQAVSWMVFNHE